MNWPIISAKRAAPRLLAVGLMALATCLLWTGSAQATEIFTSAIDETAAGAMLDGVLGCKLAPTHVESDKSQSDLIDARQLPSAYQAIGEPANRGDDAIGFGGMAPAGWIEALDSLVATDAPSLDFSANPLIARHALGASLLALEAFGNSSSSDTSDSEKMFLLAQKPQRPDGYVMREVTAALEDFATPEPDFLFLVFLAAQSLWAITARARPA